MIQSSIYLTCKVNHYSSDPLELDRTFWSHLVAFLEIWSHLVAFSVHYLNTPVGKFNILIDKAFNSHQEYTIATSLLAPARGTKIDRQVRSFFMPKYLIYWGPNPPDPLGRFAPKSSHSPNLVAFSRVFIPN